METSDATDDNLLIDTISLDCHQASDPTIPRTTSLTFTAQMERDDLLLRGAPANRADVDVAPRSQPREIPQYITCRHGILTLSIGVPLPIGFNRH